ncbi:hypothetical protein FBUS_11039 [Fasciolopsis buskii]|uniref:G-protein coupled receptors family 1 profile domain-containing protein n=1 Tax=Fasciolopsis buskii TaxID=27845 RepID=A0A8E0S3X6_9TREM|nr:hypothetical protein FBUS_11039 [Fasciolopsis buski]
MSEIGIVIQNIVTQFIAVFGLLSNIVGFISISHVEFGFPATSLLLRSQFVSDALGCIATYAYVITYTIPISSEITNGALFASIWASYYVLGFVCILSAMNMTLLSFDRLWAVRWFRTYRRDSKSYRITLISVLWTYTIILIMPTQIIAYFKYNNGLVAENTVTMCMKINSVIIYLFAFLGPGILICLFQFGIILVLQKLKEGPGARSLNADAITESNKGTVEQNVRAISWGIIIMLITYFVSRVYPYTDYVLSNFGLSSSSTVNGWQKIQIHMFAANFFVNPLALIFTSFSIRRWLWENIVCLKNSSWQFFSICMEKWRRI